MPLRTELRDVVDTLLADEAEDIELDRVGDAIGARAVSTDDIEAIFLALEAAGRRVVAAPGGGGEGRLKRVVAAARALRTEGTARPTLREVAVRAELTDDQVLGALFLLRIMQR
jgi:hypothetical protein